jgi:hypothetical protein
MAPRWIFNLYVYNIKTGIAQPTEPFDAQAVIHDAMFI